MPHFHIPLQSGSDTVLSLMKRRYDTTLFRNKVELIRRIMPDAFIGVDVIVGTRGETDECFEEAYNFIASLPSPSCTSSVTPSVPAPQRSRFRT